MPITSAVLIAFFSSFLLWSLIVLMKQTRQLISAIKQSIYLDVYDINIYSYSETSGGHSSNLYLNVALFSTAVLIGHLWKLKTVVFLHLMLVYYIGNMP